MAVTLQDNALTTLEAVLDEIGEDAGTTQRDNVLKRYINAASDFISKECGRVFQRTDAIEESVRGYGGTVIRLARAPILELTAVEINGEGILSDVTIDNAEAGTIFSRTGWPWTAALSPGITGRPVPGSEEARVAVTYSAGFVTPKQFDDEDFLIDPEDEDSGSVPRTLPSDLEDACIQLVVSRWRARGRDVRERSRTHEASGTTFGGETIPPEVDAILSHYRLIPNA